MNPFNIKENLKATLLKRRLQRALEPDQAFLKSSKQRFLMSINGGKVAGPAYTPRFLNLRPAFMTLLIMVGLTGGLAAFADKADVPITNPLYDLKRISEDTRVALTPAVDKPSVHAQLAGRRLKEIEQATQLPSFVPPAASEHAKFSKAETPIAFVASSSATPLPLVQKLSEELDKEIQEAIPTASVSATPEPTETPKTTPLPRPALSPVASVSQDNSQDQEENDAAELRQLRRAQLCKLISEAADKHFIQFRRANELSKRCAQDPQ